MCGTWLLLIYLGYNVSSEWASSNKPWRPALEEQYSERPASSSACHLTPINSPWAPTPLHLHSSQRDKHSIYSVCFILIYWFPFVHCSKVHIHLHNLHMDLKTHCWAGCVEWSYIIEAHVLAQCQMLNNQLSLGTLRTYCLLAVCICVCVCVCVCVFNWRTSGNTWLKYVTQSQCFPTSLKDSRERRRSCYSTECWADESGWRGLFEWDTSVSVQFVLLQFNIEMEDHSRQLNVESHSVRVHCKSM